PLSNYFFSASSSIVLALSITLVVELVVAKRVAALEAAEPSIDAEPLPDMKLKPAEQRDMVGAGSATVAIFGLLVLAVLPAGSPRGGLRRSRPPDPRSMQSPCRI